MVQETVWLISLVLMGLIVAGVLVMNLFSSSTRVH